MKSLKEHVHGLTHMKNNISLIEEDIFRDDILLTLHHKDYWNPNKNATVFPYIYDKKFYNGDLYPNMHIAKLFSLYNEIHDSTFRLGNSNLYHPSMYDYGNHIVRCITLDDKNEILSDGGLIYKTDDIGKLQHRWYATNLLRDRLTTKQLINHDGQFQLKYQWFVGKRVGLKMMYVTREYSNIMWKTWRANDEFFSESNGWFYTEEKIDCGGFKSFPFVWYDREHFNKKQALKYFTKSLKS